MENRADMPLICPGVVKKTVGTACKATEIPDCSHQKRRCITMMKKEYQKPTLEVIGFESEDIITTSGVGVGGGPEVPDYGEEPDWDF